MSLSAAQEHFKTTQQLAQRANRLEFFKEIIRILLQNGRDWKPQ